MKLRIQCIIRSCLLGSLAFFAACTTETIEPEQSLFKPNSLVGAALNTREAYMRAVNTGAEKSLTKIPARYWDQQIKDMKPIKVYNHMVNIVVVQRVSDNVEEGKYIYIPISSYLPRSGDDGFLFNPNPMDNFGNGIFDFERSMRN